MRKATRIALAAMTALALAGCTTMSLEKLRRTTPVGTPFQKALAKLYMDFSIDEARQYDWLDSMYFADKGLLAAYGKDTAPEALAGWRIPEDKLPDLLKAREALVAALTPERIDASPDAAASAQFHFDCWVEQQEEGWEEEEIAHCRDGFFAAMEQLTPLPAPEALEPEPAPKPKPRAKLKPKPEPQAEAAPETPPPAPVPAPEPETVSYIVFFAANTAVVTTAGAQVIDEIIQSLKSRADYEIVLTGNPDNPELAAERAETVKARLIDGGIAPEALIQTGRPTQKRVEIFLQ